MTFNCDVELGRGVLVPCRASIANAEVLLSVAKDLWKAEACSEGVKSIGDRWGCIGAAFNHQLEQADIIRKWTERFDEEQVTSIYPVDKDGILQIPWPQLVIDGKAASLDIILGTATKAEERNRPTAEEIADAWIKQEEGHERYFFKNIEYDIRTTEDLAIWRRIVKAGPAWQKKPEYAMAIGILCGEMDCP